MVCCKSINRKHLNLKKSKYEFVAIGEYKLVFYPYSITNIGL